MKSPLNQVIKSRLMMALVTATFAISAMADHLASNLESPLDDGGLISSASFKLNLWLYNSIGGVTEIKSKEKKRKWRCAWLCKRPVDKNADRIQIQNTYYSEISSGFFAELPRLPKICRNTNSCEQKEWAAGIGIKVKFPNGGTPIPGQLDKLLPIDGVITLHEIDVDGRTFRYSTSKGRHPTTAPMME